MKRLLPFIILIVLLLTIPFSLWANSDTSPRLEITGVNATELPTVIITANVYDSFGQPIGGLGIDDFTLTGALAEYATLVNVENITDDNLPFAVTLVIDTSSSMAGQPIERAKQAASSFVDTVPENTAIALYSFSDTFSLLQDFTTDKSALNNAIANIGFGGQTALYQAAYNAVDIAVSSNISRRVVVFLSDGAEYGNVSDVDRAAAAERAVARGVPFYTIGLGYGIDRTYLEDLSASTNAQFFESPSPEQLQDIYANLAALLQSQYVLTLDAPIPADGTQYDFEINVNTPTGTASDSATLRAPIPVPVINLPTFDAPIDKPVTLDLDILADDPISNVSVQLGADEPHILSQAPYTFDIDPEALLPGKTTLTVTATDEDGDTSQVTRDLEIAVLPPNVTVNTQIGDAPISEPQTIALDISGQTPVSKVEYQINDGEAVRVESPLHTFTIDPSTLPAGDYDLSITVENIGGGVTVINQPFTVASIPPVISVTGLEAGQVLENYVDVQVEVVSSQLPITNVELLVNDTPLEGTMINPIHYAPGNATFTVRTTDESEATFDHNIDFTVAELPPIIVIDNITGDLVLTEDWDVHLSFLSQTPITEVRFTVDDGEPVVQTEAPYTHTIRVLDYAPGQHALRIDANTENNLSSTGAVAFVISDAPSLTATANAPTNTPTATATADANATATQEAAVNATGTAIALEVVMLQSTSDAQSTSAAQAELNAQGTAFTQATRDSRATEIANERATQQAQPTNTTEATEATEQATDAAVAVVDAAQQQADATNTAQANAALTQQANDNATSTAQANAEASATHQAQEAADNATSTAQAQLDATSTAQTQLTQQAQAELNAQGTANAQSTRESQQTQATQNANATTDARATDEAIFNLTATVHAQATIDTQLSGIGAEETDEPTDEPTGEPTVATEDPNTPRPTLTEIGTLVSIDLEPNISEGFNLSTPIMIAIGLLLLLLLIIFFLLSRRKRDNNR